MIIDDNYLDEDIVEIPDSEIEWEELVDIYEVKGIEFYFDDLVKDFVAFYRYMFLRLGFGEPTEAQIQMAIYISSGGKDKMLLALRGLAKSLTSQLFVLWRLLRNNNEHILIRSASTKRSRNFTTFLLNLIKTTPVLQHLTPRSNQRKSAEIFDVNGADASDSPSVYSAGVTSQITGFRATMVVSDDVEVPENSRTPESRETLYNQVNESVNLLVQTETTSGEVIILGTYQSMESIYLQLEQTGAYDIMVIPAQYPEINDFYDGRIAKYISDRVKEDPSLIGTAVDKRFNMDVLNKRKAMIGRSNYELQYMLNPTSSDEMKYPLKLRDLIVYDIDPIDNPIRFIYSSEEKIRSKELRHNGFVNDYFVGPGWVSEERMEFEFKIIAVDPSGRGSDETTYVVLGLMGGKIFVLEFGGMQGGYSDEVLDTIVAKAMKHNVNKMFVEDNFGDGSITKMLEAKLRKSYPCQIEGIKATTNKEARIIDTLEPLMNQHRIIVDRQSLIKDMEKKKMYSLTYQMAHISKTKNALVHDDIVDVLELGSRMLVEFMSQTDDNTMVKFKDKEIEKMLETLTQSAFGLPQVYGRPSTNYGANY